MVNNELKLNKSENRKQLIIFTLDTLRRAKQTSGYGQEINNQALRALSDVYILMKYTFILPSHCKPTLFVPPWSVSCKQFIINAKTSQSVSDPVINKRYALLFCLHIAQITLFVPSWSVACKQFRINAKTSQSVLDLVIKNEMIFTK